MFIGQRKEKRRPANSPEDSQKQIAKKYSIDNVDPTYALSLALQKDKDFLKSKVDLDRAMEAHAKLKNELSIKAAGQKARHVLRS